MSKLGSINANLLVVLHTVIEERSVGRAAARLRLSQPAVSNHPAKLRELFKDELLIRVGSQMELTPRAEILRSDLRRGIEALEGVLTDPGEFAPERCERHFRVAMADLAEAALLPGVLARLQNEAPRASLQILSIGVFEIGNELASGELDAVVTIVQTRDLGAGFFEVPLFSSSFVIIARHGHPGVQSELSPEAYAGLELVIVTSEPEARGVIDVKLDTLGLSRRVTVRVPRSILVPPLVAATDLVAAVDAPALRPYRGKLPLRTISVKGLDLPQGSVSLLWHERTNKSAEHRWLRQLFRDEGARLKD